MAILSVSREFGSGGREIGQKVAESLGYEYVDKESILSEIRTLGDKWEKWAKDLDEHSPSIWEKYDWSFRGFGAMIQKTILTHAAGDNVVIMGRGGGFLLKGIPHALSIRVVAPLDARVERIMKRDSVDQGMARWLAEKVDRERVGFIRALYGKEVNDPSEFDFTFDTGKMSVEEVAAAVMELLRDRDGRKTEAAQKTLLMRAEAVRIKAAILTNPAFLLPTFDVEYDGKQLVLRGVVHNPKEHSRVEDFARKLAGELPVKCELHYRG
ncbi:AAA family ATPase [Desulforhabdus sp. TSK]|uniref:cytidylate kinase-like family protein n=1 Tax=Desulforhabdus sp. TSK TaxID=2925014 RepID=UPI001FC7F888|nr:cytidylate kinase-like family protein [Desulforhabdus sp. TSK]GKT08522.1 hypothetical protein DSTSK_18270 [Desulforhabdus sp. TSK]